MNQAQTQRNTLGLIIGNRGFFPDHLAKSGREGDDRGAEARFH